MKQIYIILILSLTPYLLLSKFEIEQNHVLMQQNSTLISKGNNVILYGQYINLHGKANYPINYFNGNDWKIIPSIHIDKNSKQDTLIFNESTGNIIFGNNNDFWICGNTDGFYHWNGNNLEKYFLDDNLKLIREYTNIGLDSLGNIWLTTKVTLSNEQPFLNYYTELIKFNGTNFQIITDSKNINELGFTKIFISSNNKVYVISTEVKNNLLLVDNDGSILISTIPTPHKIYNPDKFEQRLLNPLSILEDSKGSIWFGLGQGGPRDPGLIVWDNDNTWRVYTEHNNYPLRFTFKEPFNNRDSLFSICSAITEDKNGKIWVGGLGFLSYIDSDDMLVTPNIDDFLNKSTFYSSEILADSGKEAPQAQLDFLNSSDSISTIISELFNRDLKTQHTLGKIGESGGKVESMTTTEDGSIWIAFTHIGLLQYQPTKTTVENILVSQEVNLYPQPVNSADKLINIEFENSNYVSNVNIYNMSGKLIQRNNYDSQIYDKIEMRLDNNDFISGTYFAAIELKDRTIFRKFIIK